MNLLPVMAIFMVCACLSFSAKATTTKISITGEVLPETCDIDVQQLNQTIDLGDYRVTDFKQTGSVTKSVPFSLAMTNCSARITSAKMRFGGNALSGGLFSLGGTGALAWSCSMQGARKSNPKLLPPLRSRAVPTSLTLPCA